jgi:hypothetical protein
MGLLATAVITAKAKLCDVKNAKVESELCVSKFADYLLHGIKPIVICPAFLKMHYLFFKFLIALNFQTTYYCGRFK